MLKGLAKTTRVAAGLCLAFAGAALLGAALPAAAAGGDGLIAVMFLPVGAAPLWSCLALRCLLRPRAEPPTPGVSQ